MLAWDRSPCAIIVAAVVLQKAGIAARSVLVCAFLVSVAACGSSISPEVGDGPDGTPDPVLLAGRLAFADRCASCHDADGSGTGDGPRVNGGRLQEVFSDRAEAAGVVAEGRGRMPAFGGILTAGEIDAVLRYIDEVL